MSKVLVRGLKNKLVAPAPFICNCSPSSISPEFPWSSLIVKAEFSSFSLVTLASAILLVIIEEGFKIMTPVFVTWASPLKLTPVAILLLLPINILPFSKLGSRPPPAKPLI